MRSLIPIVLISAVCFQCDGQSKPSGKSADQGKPASGTLKNRADSVGYALGNNLGEFLKAQGITELSGNVNTDMIIKALKDATSNQTPVMSREQCSNTLQMFVSNKRYESIKKNKVEGEKFLAENKKKPGIVTLPSGLQYQVIKMGTGPKPTPSDRVQVHYHGTLINGTVFDSSVERNEPMTHSASGFIRGWNEALLLMPTGSKWKLFIPADLAYGDQGAGGDIPPGSALIFDIELLKVNP
jgi:FKBP-type peptidyl-prolyl cis-trans isomerase FklB